MESKFFDTVGETVYSATLPNGLKICVNPRQGFSTSFAAFATDYGGACRRFSVGGQWLDTPAGVAHFLEHKMFDMPDGDNALSILSANGADANAFTSAGMTCYYFESTRDFEENLRMLLKFVSTPYFTEESVQKEQGIIGQEIGMGEDDPGFVVYINLMKMLYARHPIRDAVAGTVESISHITAETLYSCHKVFYNPSNMTLCAAGDVDPERVYAIAMEMLPDKPGQVPENDFGPAEDDKPSSLRQSVTMEVSAPQFLLGARIKPAPAGSGLLRQKLVGQLAMRYLVGNSSPFYSGLYSEGLLTRDFDYEIDYAAGTATAMIGGESADPEKVAERFAETVKKAAEQGIDSEAFERARRASFGGRLRGLEDFDNVCVSMADGVFGGYCALDAFAQLETVEKRECEDFIRAFFTDGMVAMSVITPGKA